LFIHSEFLHIIARHGLKASSKVLALFLLNEIFINVFFLWVERFYSGAERFSPRAERLSPRDERFSPQAERLSPLPEPSILLTT